jgi:hypothetical protein
MKEQTRMDPRVGVPPIISFSTLASLRQVQEKPAFPAWIALGHIPGF